MKNQNSYITLNSKDTALTDGGPGFTKSITLNPEDAT